MARFEFGKGKKKTFWDIEQLGRVLRTQETGGVSDRLPGFRTLADEDAARAELNRLAAGQLKKGFSPVDEAAKKIATGIAPQADAAPAVAALPLRRDLSIYNEANGLMVLSMSMAGKNLEEGSRKWNKAVAEGKIIPLTLFQDDPFIVRVVAGEALTAQEEEEWVARLEWWLDVPDGKLAITGGAVLVCEDYDEDDPYYEQYLGVVDVPPGRYRATIYSYVPGVNGNAVLDHLAGGYGKCEPYGKWFRRTRPEQEFPTWLRDWCIGDDSTDPGHEAEWKGMDRPDDSEMPELVHFLVHLQPDPAATAPGKPGTEDGWFGEAEGARQIEKCPRGIEARDVISHEEKKTGEWLYIDDVHEKVRRFPLAKIEGTPVEIKASDVADLCRLSWFSHRFSVPALRAILPHGETFTPPENVPSGTLFLLHEGALNIAFTSDSQAASMIQRMSELAPHLAQLPEGTELEVACSQLDSSALEEDVPQGLHRYRGHIRGGAWQIEEAFPRLSAETLRAAFALSKEVAAGGAITINDAEEGDAILKRTKSNFRPWIEDNPGKIEDGQITLGQKEPGVLALYGAGAFSVRFGDTWPALGLLDDDDEEDVDMSIPIQGRKILETPGGRTYFATMALMVSETLAESIQKEDPKLRKIGFQHIADIVCSAFPNIAVRGYTKEGGDTWATFLVAAPRTLLFEMSTRFTEEGASLLTTLKPDVKDDAASHSYRQSAPEGDYAAMYLLHETRKAELAKRFGPPIGTEQKVASLAEAVEASLKKQPGD